MPKTKKRKRKKRIEKEKKEISDVINEFLGTDIDFTKLEYEELIELAKALDKLATKESEEFSVEKLNKIKLVLARLGYELLSNWEGPIAKALRGIFKEALEREKEKED